jgi:hypothetical protein
MKLGLSRRKVAAGAALLVKLEFKRKLRYLPARGSPQPKFEPSEFGLRPGEAVTFRNVPLLGGQSGNILHPLVSETAEQGGPNQRPANNQLKRK